MIVATMATYPKRRSNIAKTAARISPQVDRFFVVLNEYESIPDELRDFANIEPVLPPKDLKDTAKFYPDVAKAEWVFTVDDDLIYPETYVADTLPVAERFPESICGYDGTIYTGARLRRLSLSGIRSFLRERRMPPGYIRKTIKFSRALDRPTVVDQIGTGTLVARPSLLPPWEVMETSPMFVDIRLALWCYENGRELVCLPKPAGYIQPVHFEETIFDNFTRHSPEVVMDEVRKFALKNLDAGREARPIAHRARTSRTRAWQNEEDTWSS